MILPLDISQVKGFLAPEEGQALYELALAASQQGPCLEIGSYCGKSTVYLGIACKQQNQLLYAVDHHRGSEEHQPGEGYHDPDLFDDTAGKMDSFRAFRHTIQQADLEETVVPIVANSAMASRHWRTPLSLVFIDGGHSYAAALTDYRSWVGHIQRGGILAIHDIFPNPAEGGQAPHTLWKYAQMSGLFEPQPLVNTLAILRRL